jgi:hypothetical protein
MPRKQRYNLTEPLEVHKLQFDKVMTTGRYGEWEALATQPLREAFTYRRESYRWLKMGRFITDHSEGAAIDSPVEFHPILGIKLLADPDQKVGLVTDISYASFSLSAPFFENGGEAPISQLLRPVSFDIYIGDGDVEDAQTVLIRDGRFGTPDEFSTMAQAAGQSILAAVEVLQDHTIEQIETWYRA